MSEKNFRVEQLANREKRFINFVIDLSIIIGVVKYFEGDLNLNVLYITSYILYYTLFEWFTNGKTIGKFITKTRVIKDNGDSIAFKDAFLRSIIRIIPLEPWICLLTDYSYGWHDRWTNTIVLPESEINNCK